MSEKTDAEIYHEIMRKVEEKDKRIETLEKEMKELKEEKTKNAEKEDAKIAGYCNNCNKPLTVKDARGTVCPHCGAPDYHAADPVGARF